MSFILYVVMAAWQDGRKRAVSGWVFLFFFVHFLTSQICQKVFPVNMDQMPAAFWYQGMAVGTKMSFLWMGSLIGVVLLIISKCSGGALGNQVLELEMKRIERLHRTMKEVQGNEK